MALETVAVQTSEVLKTSEVWTWDILNAHQQMIGSWHQTKSNYFYHWMQIFLDTAQKIEIVILFKEYALPVIAAIIDMVIMLSNKWCFSSWQDSLLDYGVSIGTSYFQLIISGFFPTNSMTSFASVWRDRCFQHAHLQPR